uniref:THAP-type domain-containing protein n=1 Tax=Mastacembelus armatus TaxID=205130 RepID=A0A7N8XID9_9TELE
MPGHCAAVWCCNGRNAQTKHGNDLSREWALSLRRKDFVPSDLSVICSSHFKPEDFDRTGQTARLKEGVVPSVFSFPDHLPKVSAIVFRDSSWFFFWSLKPHWILTAVNRTGKL